MCDVYCEKLFTLLMFIAMMFIMGVFTVMGGVCCYDVYCSHSYLILEQR